MSIHTNAGQGFQSTHPARGATQAAGYCGCGGKFQSTHPARGATGVRVPGAARRHNFNPRTPRGVRLRLMDNLLTCWNFNPRTPRGVRLTAAATIAASSSISIHAPREGCDDCGGHNCGIILDFNPRTPRGVRLLGEQQGCPSMRFQSTHPARGATANFTKEQRVCLAQFAYLHKGKKAEHTKTNAPMLHEAFLYAFWVRTGRRRRVLLDFARYKIKGSSGR